MHAKHWHEKVGRGGGMKNAPSKGFKTVQGLNKLNLPTEHKGQGDWSLVMARRASKGQITGVLKGL